MEKKTALLVSSALVAFGCAGSGPSVAPKPPSASVSVALIDDAHLAYAVASQLATDVGPRLAGSAGDAKAIALMTRRLSELGFVNVRAEPVTVPVWRRTHESATLSASGRTEPLDVTALGWSVPSPSLGVQGEVVEVASEADLAKYDLKGKIAFCNVPTERAKDGSGYGKAVGVRAKCPLEAEKRGALAALVRSVGTDLSDRPHTGSMRREGAKIPSAALSTRSADRLHLAILAASTDAVRVSLVLGTEVLPDARSANVVAEAPGKDPKAKSEIVVLGAHLDAWDLGQGAVDDGAGVGVVVAAAHAFLRAPADRTVRVVLFAAEENSLAGARAYAVTHAAEIDLHVAALEIDAGTGKVMELRVLAGSPVVLPTVAGIAPVPLPAEGGADLSPLRALGVPMLDARQDMSDYFDVHHTSADTVDKLRPADLMQATEVVTGLARFAARGDVSFGRVAPEARVRK